MSQPGALGGYRRQTVAIGMITPSANVVVERVTAAILVDFPEVSGHFSRIPVHGSAEADGYDWAAMLGAARLLGHARLDAICWNGSKGGSISFATDHELCARITEETGVPATTSTAAIETVFRATGVKRVALVTPYAGRYQRKIIEVFAREGLTCVAEVGAGLTDNFSFCQVPDAEIARMIRTVAAAKPDAILTYCTNFPAAHLVDGLEQELDLPIYDSVSMGVWGALRCAGVATARGRRWGSVYGRDAPA
ncbi:MAG: aspartate/glutamate racemase family protein [Proteobacteria bacterium]|nr:aspartate/glutamate racemase family protein [Pseudomonadota bacterium]